MTSSWCAVRVFRRGAAAVGGGAVGRGRRCGRVGDTGVGRGRRQPAHRPGDLDHRVRRNCHRRRPVRCRRRVHALRRRRARTPGPGRGRDCATLGYPVGQVDMVVLTHLDGIGMAAAVDGDGTWTPMFPNARLVTTAAEIDFLEAEPTADRGDGAGGLRPLLHAAPAWPRGRHRRLAGGAGAGGAPRTHRRPLAWSRSGPHRERRRQAVLLGHLAISPVQLAAAQGPESHLDARAPTRCWRTSWGRRSATAP